MAEHETTTPQTVVVGGGLRASRIGELAIGRASVLSKDAGLDVQLKPIHHHPDEAGLIGAVQLAPAWMFTGHDAILALDVGGANIRAGVVELQAGFAHPAAGAGGLRCAAHVVAQHRQRHAARVGVVVLAVAHFAVVVGALEQGRRRIGRPFGAGFGCGFGRCFRRRRGGTRRRILRPDHGAGAPGLAGVAGFVLQADATRRVLAAINSDLVRRGRADGDQQNG